MHGMHILPDHSVEYVTPQRSPPMKDLVEELLHQHQHQQSETGEVRTHPPPSNPFVAWLCSHLYVLLVQHRKDLHVLEDVYSRALSAEQALEQLYISSTDRSVSMTICQLYVDEQISTLRSMSSRLDSLALLRSKVTKALRSYESLAECNRKKLCMVIQQAANERQALNAAVVELNTLNGSCQFNTANRLVSCYNCALDAYFHQYRRLMDEIVSALRSYKELAARMYQLHKQVTNHLNQDFSILKAAAFLYPVPLEEFRDMYCERFAVSGVVQVVQSILGLDTQFITEILPDISLVSVSVQTEVRRAGLVLNEPNTVHYTIRMVRTRIVGEGVAGKSELALAGCREVFGTDTEEPETASISVRTQEETPSIATTSTKFESETSVQITTPMLTLHVAELPVA